MEPSNRVLETVYRKYRQDKDYNKIPEDVLQTILTEVRNLTTKTLPLTRMRSREKFFSNMAIYFHEKNDSRYNTADEIEITLHNKIIDLYADEIKQESIAKLEEYDEKLMPEGNIPTPVTKKNYPREIGPSPVASNLRVNELEDILTLLYITKVKDAPELFEKYYYKFGALNNENKAKKGRPSKIDKLIAQIYNVTAAKLKASSYTSKITKAEFPVTHPQQEFPDIAPFLKDIVNEFKQENILLSTIANKIGTGSYRYAQTGNYSQGFYGRSYF